MVHARLTECVAYAAVFGGDVFLRACACARTRCCRATASKYTNSSFWRTICPGLHVNSAWPSDMGTATTANGEETLKCVVCAACVTAASFVRLNAVGREVEEAMKLNGYFKLDGGDWKLPVTHGTLAQCVVNLREQGLPGVFGYMFDEFWMLTRRLHSIVRRILGVCLCCCTVPSATTPQLGDCCAILH